MASRPELKLDDEGGFIRFFKSLPAVGDDTVRIFDRGDWYTAHGDDANYIAKTVRPSGSTDYSSPLTSPGLQNHLCRQTARPK
ncbi:hypothetical protein NQ176_g10534 [Zarea fungicola]|uniref:Uncharacterized protein n=1 Tax=Zarea fungicola TaxID=93591 RepID=A0ACC1MFN7_9HYPO|nr:hypothetical protein NQ176_g10534 [Lecanicillium fungicola]